MRKNLTAPVLGLIVFLLIWLHLPPLLSDSLRSRISSPFAKRSFDTASYELAQLKLENQVLSRQIDQLRRELFTSQKIKEFLQDTPFLEKREAHFKELLLEELTSTPAQVIYRDPSFWSSSLWINVGERTNRALQKKLIGVNSPVLAKGFLVGVVETVTEHQSRVRLITDPGLCPSVRACRGGLQNKELAYQIDFLLELLSKREDLPNQESWLLQIKALQQALPLPKEDEMLAKGELQGSSSTFWRSTHPVLKGVGFNLDFPDRFSSQKKPILQVGDFLVTTGLDGVFPPGIGVAAVTEIKAQKESGNQTYEIKALPMVGHLNDLQTLFVLPPQSE